MEKNNLYITNLCVGHTSIYYETPEVPDSTVGEDINGLLEDKYVTNVNIEFFYLDSTGDKHYGSVIVNEINDYQDFVMENDNFYEETQLTDENIIDLFEFD